MTFKMRQMLTSQSTATSASPEQFTLTFISIKKAKLNVYNTLFKPKR